MIRVIVALMVVAVGAAMAVAGVHVLISVSPARAYTVNGTHVGDSMATTGSDTIGIVTFCVNDGAECVSDTTGVLTVQVVADGASVTCEERER